MKLKIKDKEYDLLTNGSKASDLICTFLIVSSDPTSIDKIFLECNSFSIQYGEDEEFVQYTNHYEIVYVELRHNQDLGYMTVIDSQYVPAKGDVVTVYLRSKSTIS